MIIEFLFLFCSLLKNTVLSLSRSHRLQRKFFIVRIVENICLLQLSLQDKPSIEGADVDNSCIALQVQIRAEIFVQAKGVPVGAMLPLVDDQREKIAVDEMDVLGREELLDGVDVELDRPVADETRREQLLMTKLDQVVLVRMQSG